MSTVPSKPPLVSTPGAKPPMATTAGPVAPAQPYPYRTLKDIEQGPLRILIFGAPKVGKTELLLTFPNVAVADIDGDGVKVGLNPGFKSRHGNRQDSVRFASFHDEIDPANGIFKKATAFKEMQRWISLVVNDPWAQTVAIDSLTSFSSIAFNAGLEAATSRNRTKALGEARASGIMLKGQQDFGSEMGAVEQVMDATMALRNKHFVVIAHEREEKSDSGLVTGRSPLITGEKARAQLGKWFDEVWYLEANAKGERTLICQPRGVLKGVGSRLGLPQEIKEPSYEKIMKLVQEMRK